MKKNKKKLIIKDRIINSFMFNGQKEVSEKILFKTLKHIQRSNNKNCATLIQEFLINLTPIFKFNKQSKKRGKKKTITYIPYLMPTNALKINFGLKLLKNTILKSRKNSFFYELTQEILAAVSLNKSFSIEQKNNLQKQILAQKRYFYKFRW